MPPIKNPAAGALIWPPEKLQKITKTGAYASDSEAKMTGMIGPEIAEAAMGLDAGSLGSIAWLILREQASGSSNETVARAIRVSESDIEALIESVTGLEGEKAWALWERGVVAVIAASRANAQVIESGWDGVEALALQKLNQKLSEMRTAGDPELMLKIASSANKAIRRNERQGSHAKSMPDSNGQTTLATGQLGALQLNLSVAVQNQLTSPQAAIKPHPVMEDLEMLDLQETRKLVDPKSEQVEMPNFEEFLNNE